MDGLAFSSAAYAATAASLAGKSVPFPAVVRIRRKREELSGGQRKFIVSASKKEEPKLNEWDQMELKFGRLLGEDPKLTLAKIMARKVNPDASFVEIEKSYYKNKGKMTETEEVPLDWSKEKKPSSSSNGLNLVRPIPKDGVKFETNDKPTRPEVKKAISAVKKIPEAAPKGRVPNVILRKPSSYYVDDDEDAGSKLRLKPNLTLQMRNENFKERFSDMTLLRKPDPTNPNALEEKREEVLDNIGDGNDVSLEKQADGAYADFTLLKKPDAGQMPKKIQEQTGDDGGEEMSETKIEESKIEMLQHSENLSISSTVNSDPQDSISPDSVIQANAEASLQGKPQRLDPSLAEPLTSDGGHVYVNHEGQHDSIELKGPPSRSVLEESDWNKARDLLRTEARVDVELISSSTRGFAVSFGSLIGFLPYRNLAAKWKFLAFESWLRRNGIDPSLYRQNLGVIGGLDVTSKSPLPDSSLDPEVDKMIKGNISPDMKLEDLLMIYDKEKQKFLSSFVGQKIKVTVVMVNRNSRKLIFSMRPRENEEEVEKKRSLMFKRVGDVVKCCIKKITYFGIFCEVEGVPALIHQSEVSWDATLDPASYFKIGQIVDAKVHQLDFTLERIFLSLKEITPDPLAESLESVVGDYDSLDGRLQAAELDIEWPDVESLIKELEMVDGVRSVSRGRFFLSPGLAPTFQVYMASMFESQYKLLARAGNKVQELLVESSLSKEEMKSTIMSCTNRVQ
ncbi:PREDICTED: uncharacterized protein LOC104809401 [Tarenaya hassleriana]|uniref:uncharacterized protein LOC104809401 n=1 Tax=Tarenaya hassleriana TaxID=28532 RepID=UPI00053C6AFC|nr:PREDICTED: uncharacterized protein LOC104809401 [Tarenaya hassleriana]